MKNINNISKNYHYDTKKLAEVLDVSPRTIFRWKKAGLKYDDSSWRHYFLGRDVITFLRERKVRRLQLEADEFLCGKCKTKVKAKNDEVEKIQPRNNKTVIRLRAYCEFCNSEMSKFIKKGEIKWKTTIS